jgi:hypothetical protein
MYSENWCQKIYAASVRYDFPGLEEGADKLGFPICGGADRGEFLRVGPLNQSQIDYNRGYDYVTKEWLRGPVAGCKLKEGDIILETNKWSAVGLRRREYLGLIRRTRFLICTLRCVRRGDLPVSLRDYLQVEYPRGDANHDLQKKIRQNLLKVCPPLTTRLPRDGETDGVDYSFVTFEYLLEMERDGRLLQFKEYDGA